MKSLFDYIDGNSFLTTIIGIIVGWILNFISTMYFDKKNERRRKKKLERIEKQKRFENKPELQIDKNNSDNNINMEIFIGTFKVEYNKENHCYKDIVIKNIGKSDIECLDIVSTNKKGLILCDYNSLNNLVDNELICYDYCYDKKIRV